MDVKLATEVKQKPAVLSPEELEAFLEGVRSEKEEPDYSMEEVFAYVRDQRKAWIEANSLKSEE